MKFTVILTESMLWEHVSKILRIMKIFMVLMCFTLLHASAATYAQRITLKKKTITYKALFKEIKKQTGFDIIYAENILDDKEVVGFPFLSGTVDQYLLEALKGKNINFVLDAKSIILNLKAYRTQKETQLLNSVVNLTGKVVDENGTPISGVTVSGATAKEINGKFHFLMSISTKNDGSFTLATDANFKYLVFSYVGFETQAIPVGNNQTFNVILKAAVNPLDAIQIVGYGSTTKRLTTGSVASIKAGDLEKQPISNPIQALSGRLAGVFVTEASGVTGSTVNLQIRGQNTITGAKNPLYIIDGVPFSSIGTEYSSGTNVVNTNLGPGGGLSPFDNIPTSDIESIEVLKDADATAIYGSRAANGVVIITTRKGKAGTMRIGVNVYSGVGEITRGVKMLNMEDYLNVRRKAFANDNITPTVTNAPDLLSFGNSEADFLDYTMGNTQKVSDATFDVSGGTKQTQYMVSGNYRYQSSVFPYSFADNKSTVRFNLQTRSENNKFSLNFSGGYTKNKNNLPTTTLTSIYALPPNLPLYNPDGSFYWDNNYTNPAAALLAPSTLETDNILANSTLKYDIIPGLNFKMDLGFSRISLEQLRATTRNSRNPSTTSTGSVIMINNYTQTYTVEPQLNFSREIGPGKLDLLLGGTYLESKSVQPLFLLGSFTNDALYSNIGSVTSQLMSSGFNKSKFLSSFGRINYNMLGKYILSLNGRRDGSSRFGLGNKFGNFGSVGAAWLLSEENIIKDNAPWLSFAKLRGSYGTVGQEPLSDYAYLSRYSSSIFATAYNGVATLSPNSLANNEYRWEVTRKFEIAADLNFLKDRIAFGASWYRNRSNNLLTSIPVPSQTGFSSYLGNLPALVQNKGWEFTLDTRNLAGKDFTWNTSVNLTIPKNTLLKFPGLSSSTYANTLVIGQSLNVVQNYHFLRFENGLAQVQDLDGNGVIATGSFATTGTGDYKVSASTDPKFYGGLNNSISYKDFELDFLFSFVKKMGYNIYNSTAIPGNATNVIADVLNQPFTYTTLTGGDAALAFNRYKVSDAVFNDASYIRLKNVSLSYRFKDNFIRHIGLKGLNVYMRGQNLMTFTKYLGYDPETLGVNVPPMKLYTIGFQTSF